MCKFQLILHTKKYAAELDLGFFFFFFPLHSQETKNFNNVCQCMGKHRHKQALNQEFVIGDFLFFGRCYRGLIMKLQFTLHIYQRKLLNYNR